MPAGFNYCESHGGRIRTKKLKGGKYIHICWLNGKSYPGEVKEKKSVRGVSKR
jgi:putative hemolysin